jgi:hypothetical protein
MCLGEIAYTIIDRRLPDTFYEDAVYSLQRCSVAVGEKHHGRKTMVKWRTIFSKQWLNGELYFLNKLLI